MEKIKEIIKETPLRKTMTNEVLKVITEIRQNEERRKRNEIKKNTNN